MSKQKAVSQKPLVIFMIIFIFVALSICLLVFFSLTHKSNQEDLLPEQITEVINYTKTDLRDIDNYTYQESIEGSTVEFNLEPNTLENGVIKVQLKNNSDHEIVWIVELETSFEGKWYYLQGYPECGKCDAICETSYAYIEPDKSVEFEINDYIEFCDQHGEIIKRNLPAGKYRISYRYVGDDVVYYKEFEIK